MGQIKMWEKCREEGAVKILGQVFCQSVNQPSASESPGMPVTHTALRFISSELEKTHG